MFSKQLAPLDKALAFLRGDRDALVLHYLHLARYVAVRFPREQDDIFSICSLVLLEIVPNIYHHPTPDHYVWVALHGAAYRYLNNRRTREAYEEYPTINNERESPEHQMALLREQIAVATNNDPSGAFALREAGYADYEISEMLGISLIRLRRERRAALERFNEIERAAASRR